jgi:quercetin dioxygenase-like cupin family protein
LGAKHVKLDELVWEVVRPGVDRKVVHGDGTTVVLNRIEPGNQPKPHTHPHEQIAIILKGKTKFTVGEEVFELTANDVVVIPPNVLHFAEVSGTETCLNLDVFVPGRKDYVETPVKGDAK